VFVAKNTYGIFSDGMAIRINNAHEAAILNSVDLWTRIRNFDL
jgi:hypothetical protein